MQPLDESDESLAADSSSAGGGSGKNRVEDFTNTELEQPPSKKDVSSVASLAPAGLSADLLSANLHFSRLNTADEIDIEQLREFTEDIQNLLQSASIAAVFLDDKSRIRRFTPKAAELFGLVPGDMGRKLAAFPNPLQHADLLDDIRQTLGDGESVEKVVIAHSGERFLLRMTPYQSRRRVSGVVLTLISLQQLEADRQQLETREARFRGTFENAAVGIAHVDLFGNWLRVNQRLCELVGFSREELLEMDFQSITHPDDLNDDLEIFSQLTAGVIEKYTIRKRYIHKSGRVVPIDLTVSLQHEPCSKEPYCISIVQDATERVKYQTQLEQSISQRDQFLAVLSHELRNPLGAVINALELLRRTQEDKSQRKELMDLLNRQTEHMSRLVEDLLDTTRITQNKIVLQRELIDLRDLAVESVASYRGGFERKGLALTLETEGELFTVVGDRTRLLQVVENLLANARRYTHVHGTVKIQLNASDGMVSLSVSDNGQGIDPAHMDSIFDMFSRGRETEETQGGLGIGLALVKMLVDKHGGRLTSHSGGIGKGASFTISLPLVNAPTRMELEGTAPRDLPPVIQNTTYRVVLIEDDDDARTTLASLLELDGHRVTSASNGTDGLAAIRELQPDFALVDLSMPEVSGIDVANQLVADGTSTSVRLIALTGHGQPRDRQRTTAAGFVGHLVKPIDTDELNGLMMKLAGKDHSQT